MADSLIITLFTVGGGVFTAVIGVVGNKLLKKTPDAVSPEQYALDMVKTLSGETKELRDQMRAERDDRIRSEAMMVERVEQLKKDVERLWQNTVVLKRHIIELEEELCENDLAVPPRPPEVQAIFS